MYSIIIFIMARIMLISMPFYFTAFISLLFQPSQIIRKAHQIRTDAAPTSRTAGCRFINLYFFVFPCELSPISITDPAADSHCLHSIRQPIRIFMLGSISTIKLPTTGLPWQGQTYFLEKKTLRFSDSLRITPISIPGYAEGF